MGAIRVKDRNHFSLLLFWRFRLGPPNQVHWRLLKQIPKAKSRPLQRKKKQRNEPSKEFLIRCHREYFRTGRLRTEGILKAICDATWHSHAELCYSHAELCYSHTTTGVSHTVFCHSHAVSWVSHTALYYSHVVTWRSHASR